MKTTLWKIISIALVFLSQPILSASMNSGFIAFNYQINDWDTVCFRAGTKISMFDGSKKTIESIKIGDSVKAYNEETGQFVDSKVNNVFKKQTTSYLQITLDNGEIIEVTPEHPFYTNTGWLAAKELKQNSLIKAINGFISVQSINQVKEQSEVYNFEVEQYHNYLVGNAGAVVHNDCIRGKDGNLSWKEESYQLKNGETEVTDKATEARVALLEGAERAIKYMPAEVVDKFSSLLTPESLQFLAGVSVAYAISHGIGVGEAADLIMAGATYVWLGNEAISVLSDIGSFASGSINARTQVEMERASQHLANAIGTLTVDGTLINIGSGLGRLVENSRIGGGANIGTKLEYVFGKATGSAHNIRRSKGMLRQLESVGIFDNVEGRFLLNSHLESVYGGTKGIRQSNGRPIKRVSLNGTKRWS